MSWTTSATLPERKHGVGWTTSATASDREHGPGWFTLLEKVVPLAGVGQLAGTVQATYPLAHPALGGVGSLSAVVTPVKPVSAAFTAGGELSARTQQSKAVTAAFSGTTGGINVAVDVNDGLTAVISGGLIYADGLAATVNAAPGSGGAQAVAANLTAVGSLSPVVVGYEYAQGLAAATVTAAVSAVPVTATLSGGGVLAATVAPKLSAAATLSGSGSLTATVVPKLSTAAALSGSGTLTATAALGSLSANFDLTAAGMLTATLGKTIASVALSGDGALSATVTGVSVQSVTAALSGAGALSVTAITPIVPISAALSGAGALTAAGFSKLTVAAAFSSTGTLSAVTVPVMAAAAAFSGAGALSATAAETYTRSAALAGTGALTATASQKYAVAAAFTGSGTLSATVTQVPIPTITNITTSPFHVGDTLTITGTGYTGTVTVTVGGVAATSVTVGSSTSLTCVVPSVALGARNVVVTAASGASSPYSITLVAVGITLVGANAAAGTSVTIPTHAVGDLIIIFAYRDGSTTIPTKPAASGTVPTWTDITITGGGSLNTGRTARFTATATTTTTGAWTGATGMVAVVLRGHFTTTPIGGTNSIASDSSFDPGNVSNSIITLANTDGTSAVLFMAGHRSVTAWGTAPSGWTRRAAVATEVFCNSLDITTSVPGVNQTFTGTNSGYFSVTTEIRQH